MYQETAYLISKNEPDVHVHGRIRHPGETLPQCGLRERGIVRLDVHALGRGWPVRDCALEVRESNGDVFEVVCGRGAVDHRFQRFVPGTHDLREIHEKRTREREMRS